MSLGERIRENRKLLGLSKGELAGKLGLSIKTIWTYENGRSYPNAQTIARLCRVFNCSADYLIENEIAEAKWGGDERQTLRA